MPNYHDYMCPVCKKRFEKDDDIVTCPECGTPHHRECYNMIGHCVNKGLHKSGYSFLQNEEAKPLVSEEYYVPTDNSEAEIEIEEIVKKKNDTNNNSKGFSPFATVDFDTNEYQGTGKIGEYDVTDIASTVRSNARRFVSIFKKLEETGKKTSWNWGAFFFGSLYLLFRKMYKQGVALFCIVVSLFFGTEALIMKFAPEFVAQVQKISEEMYASKATIPDVNVINNIPQIETATKVTYIFIGIIFVIRIILALFTDHIYKKQVFDIIKKVDEQLSNGANFTQTSLIIGQTGEMDQNQMRKIYLGSKGGVTIFAPFLAYTVVYLIRTFFI